MAGLQKAKIIVVENRSDIKEILVMFNPSEYKISKNVNYNKNNVQSQDTQDPMYGNGECAELDLVLFFDCDLKYKNNNDSKNEIKAHDVRKYTERIMSLMKPGENQKPPLCDFIWGSFSFRGYISSVTQSFTRFTQEGIPIRAEVNLKFIEQSKKESNNKNEFKKYGEIETYKEETESQLCNIAYKLLNSPNEWRKIADKMGINNPRDYTIKKN